MQHVTPSTISRSFRVSANNIKNFNNHVHSAPTQWTSSLTFNADVQPTVKSDNGSGTLRSRQHGNRSLPLSTILDPIAIDARTKHEKPKQRPQYGQDVLTPFQRDLSANVYAWALASPVRQCMISKARLPSHLLIPFIESLITLRPQDISHTSQPTKPVIVPALTFKTKQPMSWAFASADAICQLSGRRAKWPLLVSEQMKRMHALRTMKSVDKVKVRKEWQLQDGANVARMVYEKLGSNLLSVLKWCLGNQEHVLLVPSSTEMARDRVACILHVGGDASKECDIFGGVPQFDLSQLLQDQHLHQAKTLLAPDHQMLALLKHPQAVVTHLALLKLQQYRADDEKICLYESAQG